MNQLQEEGLDIIARQQEAVEKMLTVDYLRPENTEFFATGTGFVSVRSGEITCSRAAFHRCFPFNDPDHFISVRDENQKEIGLIESLADFPAETRRLIEDQLNLRYFTPLITKICEVKEEYGYSYWAVETDRGAYRCTVRLGGGSVSRISDIRLLITDIDGNRFEIPDLTGLSVNELKKIDLFI